MTARLLYLLLAVVGAIVPYVPIFGWLGEQTLDGGLPGRFIRELFSTRVGTAFGLDVLLSALVLFTFMLVERQRRQRPRMWPALLATLLAGVSCGLPLYLFERERTREGLGGGWGGRRRRKAIRKGF